jgi:hypothetical protein
MWYLQFASFFILMNIYVEEFILFPSVPYICNFPFLYVLLVNIYV